MQTHNPDYPPDYDEYLENCYDSERGETTKSYEEWSAGRPQHLRNAGQA